MFDCTLFVACVGSLTALAVEVALVTATVAAVVEATQVVGTEREDTTDWSVVTKTGTVCVCVHTRRNTS